MLKIIEYFTKGIHLVLDAYEISNNALDIDYIEKVGKKAIEISGATNIGIQKTNRSVLFLLTESHLSFHINGNNLFCCFYTCGGETTSPVKGIEYIIEKVNPKAYYTKRLDRGMEYSIIIQ